MTRSIESQEAGIEVIKKNTEMIQKNQEYERSHREQSERTHDVVTGLCKEMVDLNNGKTLILRELSEIKTKIFAP